MKYLFIVGVLALFLLGRGGRWLEKLARWVKSYKEKRNAKR